MHPHEALITKFYTAFEAGDAATMGRCYHPEVTFEDPAFSLKGPEVEAMWTMLIQRGTDLQLRFRDVKANDTMGSAHWDADYTFSTTGRMVNNRIDAAFTFQDGLIKTHVDTFEFWAWSRMALGVPGLLLGWTPFLKNKVRKTAGKQLESFMKKTSGAGSSW